MVAFNHKYNSNPPRVYTEITKSGKKVMASTHNDGEGNVKVMSNSGKLFQMPVALHTQKFVNKVYKGTPDVVSYVQQKAAKQKNMFEAQFGFPNTPGHETYFYVNT